MNLLFFDIDGTLTDNETGLVPKSTINAVKQASANGNLCFINSGRPMSIIEPRFVEMMDGVISGLGTYIECKGEVLFYKPLDDDLCKKIMELAIACHVECSFEGRDYTYNLEHYEDAMFNFLNKDFKEKKFRIKYYPCEDIKFEKFCRVINDIGDQKTFDDFVCQYFDKIDRGHNFVEYQRKGVSKASGIEFLQKHYGVDLEHCYAFGDSNNDWSMLSHVKHSVLMGNGEESLKGKVEFVSTDSGVDGIEVALKHYELI